MALASIMVIKDDWISTSFDICDMLKCQIPTMIWFVAFDIWRQNRLRIGRSLFFLLHMFDFNAWGLIIKSGVGYFYLIWRVRWQISCYPKFCALFDLYSKKAIYRIPFLVLRYLKLRNQKLHKQYLQSRSLISHKTFK